MPSDFLEKTLEDIIFENRQVIHTKGLQPFKKTAFRQFILPSGKKIDIIAYDITNGHISIDVYELKRDVINLEAVCQGYNYFIEISSLISTGFKSWDINLIMVGRRYEPISTFERISLPFSVYTYDYELNGISFTCTLSRKHSFCANENFSLGLWAFGSTLHFSQGQPDSMNLVSQYLDYVRVNPDFEYTLKQKQSNALTQYAPREIHIKEYMYVEKKQIETKHFPEKLGWSEEFAREIPPPNYIWEDCEIDESELEADYADYEPDSDDEPTSDKEYNLHPAFLEDQTAPSNAYELNEMEQCTPEEIADIMTLQRNDRKNN